MLLNLKQGEIMKSQASAKGSKKAKVPALKKPMAGKKAAVQKSIPGAVVAAATGTAGIALISTALAGVAGFFAWKNREKILGFVGQYIDLPESLQASEGNDESKETWDTKGTLSTVTPESYTKPTTEHRM
jgi:hypothetical protein